MGLALTLVSAGLFSADAHALTFSFSQIAGDTLTSAQAAAFTSAGQAWSAVLTDNVNVNLSIGFKSLEAGVLGQTSASRGLDAYASFVASLTADASSTADAAAILALPALGVTPTVVLTTAQARALGIATPGVTFDAIIEFSTGFSFANTRNADGSITSGLYDLIGIVEHEIGHALGFASDAGSGLTRTVLDLFRYQTGGTTLSYTTGEAASFSLDRGLTDLAVFSTGSDFQASHWLNNSATGGKNLLMDPALASGQAQNIQALDLLAMDVIGWNVAVPEPGSMLLMGSALVLLRSVAKRRRA